MKAIALPWRFSIRLPVYVVVLYIRLSPTLNCNDESDIKSCHCSICEHLRRDLIVNVSYSFCPTVYSDTKCYTDLVTPSLRSWLYTEISFIFHYSIEASLLVISSTVSFIYMNELHYYWFKAFATTFVPTNAGQCSTNLTVSLMTTTSEAIRKNT